MKKYMQDNNLRLRAPEPEDLEMMYKLENEPLNWKVGCSTMPYSRFTLKQYIEQSTNDFFADKQMRLMVEDLFDGKVLGCVDLTNFEPLHDRAEVGIAIVPEHRKEGVGGRVLQMLCCYAFDFLHLHQLVAYVPSDNEASLRLFRGQGFTEEHLLKDWLRRDGGGYRDAVLMVRFKESLR